MKIHEEQGQEHDHEARLRTHPRSRVARRRSCRAAEDIDLFVQPASKFEGLPTY